MRDPLLFFFAIVKVLCMTALGWGIVFAWGVDLWVRRARTRTARVVLRFPARSCRTWRRA